MEYAINALSCVSGVLVLDLSVLRRLFQGSSSSTLVFLPLKNQHI